MPEPTRSETTTRRRRWRRVILGGLVAVAAAAGAVGVVLVVQPSSEAVAPAGSASTSLEAVAVSPGSLTVTASVDGTVVEDGEIIVVNRIEGQVPGSGSNLSPADGTDSQPTAGPTAQAGGATAQAGGAIQVDVATAATLKPAAIRLAADVTEPSTTVPDDTSTTSPTPSNTVPEATTTVPEPTTTVPTAPTSTTPPPTSVPEITTTLPETPTSSVPSTGGPPSGGARPGGFAAVSGGSVGGSSGGSVVGSSSSGTEVVTQTVTGLPEVGNVIGLGDTIYTVDGQPVVVLGGQLPAWRTLSADSDAGPDIEQLEGSLVWLGYDPDGDITVDDEWDSATTAAVKEWQRGLGVELTGEVTLGSVVFLPRATTVTELLVGVGDPVGDGTRVLNLSGSSQHVVIAVPDELQGSIEAGRAVEAGGQAATVTRLEGVEGDDGVSVQAVITPNAAPEGWEAGDVVQVQVSDVLLETAMLVPADAVVSRIDGTYAVQTSAVTGSDTFLPVEVLGVSNGQAAISGEGVAAALQVYRPA